MKRVVACLVLAVALAGCGSSEPGWQDDWRDSSRQFVNDPELTPTAELRQACMGVEIFDPQRGGMGYEDVEEAELAFKVGRLASLAVDNALDGSGRSRAEILADYGVEETSDVYWEAFEIVLDEIKRACP